MIYVEASSRYLSGIILQSMESDSPQKIKRVVSDWHSCASERWFPGKSHHPDHILTLDELNRINRLREYTEDENLLPFNSLIKRVSFSEPQERIFEGWEDNAIISSLQNYIEDMVRSVRYLSCYLEPSFWRNKSNRSMIAPYFPSSDARRGYRALAVNGVNLSFVSGVTDDCEPAFVRTAKVAGFATSVDPKYSAFLTRKDLDKTLWPSESIATKLVTTDFFTVLDGVPPIVIEDAEEICRYAALLRGLLVINPLPEHVAKKKIQNDFPEELKPFCVPGGQIIYGVKISEVPKKLKEMGLI